MLGPMNLDANFGGAGTSFCADTVACPRKMSPKVRTNKRPAKPSNNRLLGEVAPWFAGSAIQFFEYIRLSLLKSEKYKNLLHLNLERIQMLSYLVK